MRFKWIETYGRYSPIVTPDNVPSETVEEYCRRMRPLLPNFPAEVLSQWFFDHWSQIDDYAWLGFDRLRFDRREWTSEQIMQSGIQENDSIQIDHRQSYPQRPACSLRSRS